MVRRQLVILLMGLSTKVRWRIWVDGAAWIVEELYATLDPLMVDAFALYGQILQCLLEDHLVYKIIRRALVAGSPGEGGGLRWAATHYIKRLTTIGNQG